MGAHSKKKSTRRSALRSKITTRRDRRSAWTLEALPRSLARDLMPDAVVSRDLLPLHRLANRSFA